MKEIILLVALSLIVTLSFSQNEKFVISGIVKESNSGLPLPGAVISPGDLSIGTITDQNGKFSLQLVAGNYTISASYLGFEKSELKISLTENIEIIFNLKESGMDLRAVEIMATGYQEIPKERATGSFVQLDNELINRRVSTNLIDRLEDVTPGLIFNRTGPANDPISIRGRSTIFANTQPLIIIDNFPYDGPLENINPNDVETITVLRDAAAASVWGARAGNGVIVITTKTGKVGKPSLSVNSNINFFQIPDLFYQPVMSVDDFIEVEQLLFSRNFYNAQINNINRPALSPAVEAMIKANNGLISLEELEEKFALFRSRDTRRELTNHFHRPAVNQQYNINLNGGFDNYRYSISAGFDKNLDNIVGNDNSRYTLSIKNSWSLLKNHLELNTGVYLSRWNRNIRTDVPRTLFPYEVFSDELGNPLPVTFGYSRRFIESISEVGLLDWNYYPIKEVGAGNNHNQENDVRLNLNLSYKIVDGLKAGIFYQYWTNGNNTENLQGLNLFSTRDLVNRFTQQSPGGVLSFPVPRNSILDIQNTRAFSHSLRGQLSYNKNLSSVSTIDAVAGWELKDLQSISREFRYYGYRENIGISQPVDLISNFRQFHNGFQTTIFDGTRHRGFTDRFLSQYFNAAYTYKKRYNLSFSARRDASNLFGVDINQRAVPLWSSGLGWVISEESFFNLTFLPFLKLRATYGENGNVDKSVSALTTAAYFANPSFLLAGGELAALITSPENRSLRWERIRIFNLGLDFETKNSRIRGSIETYVKNGIDLIGDSPFSPSTGFFRARVNSASTKTTGMDLDIQSINVKSNLQWTTNLMLSTIKEEVTDYFFRATPLNYLAQSQGQLFPLEGRPLFSIYSLPWLGLNPDNGNPVGILNGEPSENYSAIFASTSPEDLTFHGPRRPGIFGALRNTFLYKGLTLSVNMSFRGAYYYRRESVLYNTILRGQGGHADFSRRWQQPGDELTTNVPSMPLTANNVRDNFYRYAETLVERGDHVRLQDVRLSYNLNSANGSRFPFKNAEIYTYINNLGIIWKKSSDPIDPDFRQMLPPRSIAMGININF
ncbi:SusC/RagA family TonB-linked outer membrane protein [Mongoliitalea lutea]|uniref:SusC/RagA family TonB-linked outer membrane protein n=1 Tax=Mongoliitalea lutea TaxID=849756 RepID=A0A8J3G4Q2_9BACT|nr:SusC/RagA family TonB-linked outer membrane protein [Mongoliitalea lutea]GHB32349.1 SusC/RagA family TonB-linked outer membrane protein [Mongoliitalea lutea]